MKKCKKQHKSLKIVFCFLIAFLLALPCYADSAFYIQLEAFKQYNNVKNFINQYANAPYRIIVTKEKKFYVVRVGPLKLMTDVQKALSYFKKDEQDVLIRVRKKPYSNIILEHNPDNNIQPEAVQAKKQNEYTIKDSEPPVIDKSVKFFPEPQPDQDKEKETNKSEKQKDTRDQAIVMPQNKLLERAQKKLEQINKQKEAEARRKKADKVIKEICFLYNKRQLIKLDETIRKNQSLLKDLEDYPDCFHRAFAAIKISNHEYEKAISHLKIIKEKLLSDIVNLVYALIMINDYAEAGKYINFGLIQYNNAPELLYDKAILHIELEQLKQAKETLVQVLNSENADTGLKHRALKLLNYLGQ